MRLTLSFSNPLDGEQEIVSRPFFTSTFVVDIFDTDDI